jgi:2-octaprenylphenol hydroxylase
VNKNVIIVGGGIVGLTLAALLAKNDFSVSVIEEKKPELNWDANHLTARVSAIHFTSCQLFSYLGLSSLFTQSAPLHEMEIWDHTHNAHMHFDSRDANESQMGFIIENRLIVKTLWEKLITDPRVTVLSEQSPETFAFKKTDLIVGADGAHSWVRKHMPISMHERPYQQKAIIAVIESEKPHKNKAIQKFLTTGPVALLPLKNAHHTALVWSADNEISDELFAKSTDDFSQSLTHALDFKLGKLKSISERSQFPLVMRNADEYASENHVLVGDAAHTIHPLAGLGVNLGLMDAAALTQVLMDARAKKKDFGELRILRRYTRWRKSDNNLIICSMRALQEIFALDSHAINLVRSFGINTIDQCSPIKNQLMNMAMGKSSEVPEFLQ